MAPAKPQDSPSPKSDTAQGDSEQHVGTKEATSLKRGREGSVEPNLPAQPLVQTKKNRLDTELAGGPAVETDPANASPTGDKAKDTVGEVSRKVKNMTWKEGDKQADGLAEDENVGEQEGETALREVADGEKARGEKDLDGDVSADWVKVDGQGLDGLEEDEERTAKSESENLKRKTLDRSESSLGKLDNGESKKQKSSSPPPFTLSENKEPAPTPAPAPAPLPAKKPQATFGAFASTSSPFAAVKSSSALDSSSSNSDSAPA
ncbi:hypothetical protein P7C73_g6793, partial [Tremellales sp. Uapishka_1]